VVVALLHVLVSFSHVHIPDLSQLLVALDIHLHLSKQNQMHSTNKSLVFSSAKSMHFYH
jgi:hypothetical protein